MQIKILFAITYTQIIVVKLKMCSKAPIMIGKYRKCQCRIIQIHKLSQNAVYQCSVFFDLGKVNLSLKFKKT